MNVRAAAITCKEQVDGFCRGHVRMDAKRQAVLLQDGCADYDVAKRLYSVPMCPGYTRGHGMLKQVAQTQQLHNLHNQVQLRPPLSHGFKCIQTHVFMHEEWMLEAFFYRNFCKKAPCKGHKVNKKEEAPDPCYEQVRRFSLEVPMHSNFRYQFCWLHLTARPEKTQVPSPVSVPHSVIGFSLGGLTKLFSHSCQEVEAGVRAW